MYHKDFQNHPRLWRRKHFGKMSFGSLLRQLKRKISQPYRIISKQDELSWTDDAWELPSMSGAWPLENPINRQDRHVIGLHQMVRTCHLYHIRVLTMYHQPCLGVILQPIPYSQFLTFVKTTGFTYARI